LEDNVVENQVAVVIVAIGEAERAALVPLQRVGRIGQSVGSRDRFDSDRIVTSQETVVNLHPADPCRGSAGLNRQSADPSSTLPTGKSRRPSFWRGYESCWIRTGSDGRSVQGRRARRPAPPGQEPTLSRGAGLCGRR